MVPFSRDAQFIKRDNIIAQLDSILRKPDTHNRAVHWGLGGIGCVFLPQQLSYGGWLIIFSESHRLPLSILT